MRILLFVLALLVVTAAIGSRAEAQKYPWCAIYGSDLDGSNCGFTTIQQCMAAISGNGGFCQENNQYQPGVGPIRRKSNRSHT